MEKTGSCILQIVDICSLDREKKLHNTKYPKVTCPGFPGYCSESYPGDVCLVVCAFGRNNVPQCQVCYIFLQLPFLFLW